MSAEPLTKQDREAILYNLRNPVAGNPPLTLNIAERYEATLVAASRSLAPRTDTEGAPTAEPEP